MFLQRCVPFVLVLGLCMAAQAQSPEIVVSQIAPLSDTPVATVGRLVVLGTAAAFAEAGRKGGPQVRQVVHDDKFEPSLSLELARAAVDKDKPAALIIMSTASNVEVLCADIPNQAKTPLFTTRTGSPAVRLAGQPYIFHSRAAFEDELGKLATSLASVGYRNVGVLYQRDAFGESGLAVFKAAAQRAGIRLKGEAGYDRSLSDVDKAVQEMRQLSPTTVLMVASGAGSAAFAKAYRAAGGSQLVVGISDFDLRGFASDNPESVRRGVGASQVIPNPEAPVLKLAVDYRAALKAADPASQPNNASFEGYIVGRVILEGLRSCAQPCTGESLRAALDRLKRIDIGGYTVDLSKDRRSGTYADLAIISADGKVLY
ncbi:ABC transporter substrate-binding protein [Xenophilus arseniciresistens]|uniref:ABC transporter substrate-binding protein n=1 Tax=Xenophilus arseniciresistens TaxID=1283306 RepID=A0AAE3NA25_9BURK|nr:ABC transporter substrate-binding protein [Xenophilus arseniciresistens]MDA7417086.1 ABC transporter substrate-binding protein [Xenophilus arseniciresistens]